MRAGDVRAFCDGAVSETAMDAGVYPSVGRRIVNNPENV
jgi:hypothetical protein